MKTTFVLHGGKTSIDSTQNDEFFKQGTYFVEKEKVHIVLCYWAREKSLWESFAKQDIPRFSKNKDKEIICSIANDVRDLYSQLESADVLYVRGGKAELIEPYYPQLSNLKERLEGKVYLGSSMGAFMASNHYVLSYSKEQDNRRVHDGLGLLPINVLCHWSIETHKQTKIDLLQKEDSSLPIVLLDEQKLVSFMY